MKALSVKQPFATWLLDGTKDKEHRTFSTKFRGMVVIHSSKIPDKKFMKEYGLNPDKFPNGFLLGIVTITEVEKYDKKMFGWVVEGPVRFPNPVPAKGKLSFWNVDDKLLEKAIGGP